MLADVSLQNQTEQNSCTLAFICSQLWIAPSTVAEYANICPKLARRYRSIFVRPTKIDDNIMRCNRVMMVHTVLQVGMKIREIRIFVRFIIWSTLRKSAWHSLYLILVFTLTCLPLSGNKDYHSFCGS